MKIVCYLGKFIFICDCTPKLCTSKVAISFFVGVTYSENVKARVKLNIEHSYRRKGGKLFTFSMSISVAILRKKVQLLQLQQIYQKKH